MPMGNCVKVISRLFVLAGLLVGTGGGVAWGQDIPALPFEPGKGNLKLGPVRVHPFAALGELYDDNVFLKPRDKRDDFITVISPGLVLGLPVGRHAVAIGYRADIVEFAELSREDNVRHTGRVQANGDYPGGLSWAVQDEVKRTNERADTEIEPLIEHTRNDGSLEAEYAFADRWSAGVGYQNTVYDYDNQPALAGEPTGARDYGTALNRMEQLGTVDLYYRVQPKTALLIEYGYGNVSYFDDGVAAARDNVIQRALVGVRGELTSKVTALVKAGYQGKHFDDGAQADFDGAVAIGTVQYQPTDYTRVTLLLDRSTPESSFRARGDEFYVNQGVTVRAEHVLNDRVRTYVEGFFADHDYQTSTRNDDLYGGVAGVRYQVHDYVGVSAEYLFVRRDSNIAGFDYPSNRVFLRVMVAM